MMDIIVLKEADDDLSKFTADYRETIHKHISKISQEGLSRKHLHYGLPYFVDKVGYSGRIVYDIQENQIFIVRIFNDHKEYERWLKN